MSDPETKPLVSARNVHKSYVMGKRTVDVLRGVRSMNNEAISRLCAVPRERGRARSCTSWAVWIIQIPAKSGLAMKTWQKWVAINSPHFGICAWSYLSGLLLISGIGRARECFAPSAHGSQECVASG